MGDQGRIGKDAGCWCCSPCSSLPPNLQVKCLVLGDPWEEPWLPVLSGCLALEEGGCEQPCLLCRGQHVGSCIDCRTESGSSVGDAELLEAHNWEREVEGWAVAGKDWGTSGTGVVLDGY